MEQEHPHTDYQKSHPHVPYWKRAHRDWKLWVAVLIMLGAMAVYIVTVDLSMRPNGSNTAARTVNPPETHMRPSIHPGQPRGNL
jgi:hypothetical protein